MGLLPLISLITFIVALVFISQQNKSKKAIIELLSKENKCYCDDCIADLCEISKRQDLIDICNKNKKIFEKNMDKNCDRCGNLKLTRRYIQNN